MLKDYSTRAAYDSDYANQVYRTPVPVPLPAATVTFDGATVTPAPAWTAVRQGGELLMRVGDMDHPGRGTFRVANVNGATITLDRPTSVPHTVEDVPEAWAEYWVPQVRCGYLSCVLRQPTYLVMDAMIAALGMVPGQTVAMIGCGMGWEVERLVALGFTAVGVETSPWIQSAKGTSEADAVDEALVAAGYDPTQGEGLIQRAAMLAQPRSTVTTLLLDEQMSSSQAQRRVRSALGLSGNAKATWALSIGVMQVLLDAEAVALNGEMFEVATNVAHYITVLPDVDPQWNQKTAEQWKVLLTPAKIVPHGDAVRGYEII